MTDTEYTDAFLDAWFDTETPAALSQTWRRSLRTWRAHGLELETLLELVDQVRDDDEIDHEYKFAYLAGCCWRTLEDEGKWRKLRTRDVLRALSAGPLRRSELAAAVGRSDSDGTLARMLRRLEATGRIRRAGWGVWEIADE